MEYENQNYPQEWICPICQELMKDPVIADDGFSYQRKSIQNWFKTSNISPITGLPLSTTKLIPNRALKNTIAQYMDNRALKLQSMKLQEKHPHEKKRENLASNQDNTFLKVLKNHRNQNEQQIELKAYSVFNNQDENYILNFQIVPPQDLGRPFRKPVSLVCILDTSESMNIDAIKDSKDKESHGFSRLDLVRHSINTLIQFMNQGDQLTLITFNTGAHCVMQTTKMNNAGKKAALRKIKQLQGQGTTNIWEGLRISLQVLKKINHKDKNVFTILLTDGQPNLNPPRGIVPTLKKYIDIEGLKNPNIHVFGYGYQLDTKLLVDIARQGAGTFAYIPDCSMVGTVFVNFMANCLSTITNRAQLQIEYPKGFTPTELIGFAPFKQNTYNLGCILYGQSRNILMKFPKSSLSSQNQNIKFNLKYGSSLEQQNILQISVDIRKIQQTNPLSLTQFINLRYSYLQLLKNAISNGSNLKLTLSKIDKFYQKLLLIERHNKNDFIEALIKEVKQPYDENYGQVEKAFISEEFYQKWGKIYIPSLNLAHIMQVCTNFKDPALQLYGGKMFEKYQNQMDTIFIKMQPPKPSAKKEANIVYKPAPVDMSDYYNNYGGCIDGECEVTLWRSNIGYQKVKLKDVKKGDIIGKNRTEITCMVETRVYAFVDMVKLGNLVITPWHPIHYQGKWIFPINVKPPQKIFVESYFNFVTKNNQSLQIQDVQCISLGHEIQNNEVTQHQYLSTKKVIKDLQSNSQAYQNGHVQIRSVERNSFDGKIKRFLVI